MEYIVADRPLRVGIVGAGAKAGISARDVAAQSDVLITMLPNSPDVELVALGHDGIIEGARPGLIFAPRHDLRLLHQNVAIP